MILDPTDLDRDDVRRKRKGVSVRGNRSTASSRRSAPLRWTRNSRPARSTGRNSDRCSWVEATLRSSRGPYAAIESFFEASITLLICSAVKFAVFLTVAR
jgi:hypothetical protein